MARILIVDGDPNSVEVLRSALNSAGCEPACATTARRGLHLVRNLRPDAILLELQLPDLSGTELCRRLSAERTTCDIPVIIVTEKVA